MPQPIPTVSRLVSAQYLLPKQLLVSLFLHLHAPSLLHRFTHLTESFFSFLVISSFGAAHLQLTSEQQHLQSPQTHHGAATFFLMQTSAKTSRSCRALPLRMSSTLTNYKGGNKLTPSGQSWRAGKKNLQPL